MPSLREGITKSFRRLGRRDRTLDAARAETMVASDPRAGKNYASYRILRSLGFGGMGQVYLAIDTRLGRHAALKFLDHRLPSDPAMLDRLHQEARTASSLNHPNILTIYEICEANGEHFIASEYVEGITLRAALDRKLISAKSAVEIATQVASALVPAHAAGIIHRDLKSSNIMIRPDGLVKVIDFGLAKLSQERGSPSSPQSASGVIAGTAEYMSPEQARGDDLDHRTDLWSLGVVLYESLAGKFPFDGPTESHAIVALLDQPVPPIENTSLPRGITEVIDRALTKDRTKRYQSAAQLLEDLQTLGVSKQRISAIKQFAVLMDAKRSQLVPAILASVGLLLVAFGVWWWAFDGKERVFGPNWFVPGPAEQVTFDGRVRLAAISPDGKYLAYTSVDTNKETLRIRNLSAKTELQIPATDQQYSYIGLTFPPGSDAVYYVVKDLRDWGRLYSVGVNSTVPKMLLDDIDGPVTFSPDGKEFAFVRRTEEPRTTVQKIVVMRSNDMADPREIVRKANTTVGEQVAWSPDGRRIAAVVSNPSLRATVRPHLYLFSIDGEPEAEYSSARMTTLDNPTWLGDRKLIALTAAPQSLDWERSKVYQLAPVENEFHQLSSEAVVPESLSATKDGMILAAVRNQRVSALWIADAKSPNDPHMLRPEADLSDADSFSWLGLSEMVVAASDAKSILLSRLRLDGKTEGLGAFRDCVEQQPVSTPDERSIVYSSNCGAGGKEFNLWQLDLKTGTRRRLTSGSNNDTGPQVTPDGKWIVYASRPSTVPAVWKIQVGGGAPRPLSNVQAQFPDVSPDGKRFVSVIREHYDGKRRVAVLSVEDGSVLREFPEMHVRVPVRWSPDGGSFDYIDLSRTTVWRQPLAGGPPRQLTRMQDGNMIVDFSWNRNGTTLGLLTEHSKSDVILFRRVKSK